MHALPERRVHRPVQSRAACDGNSGGMRRQLGRLGRHATAALPACATILAIMPTSTEPIPARVPCQDAIPAEVPPDDALPPSIRAVA